MSIRFTSLLAAVFASVVLLSTACSDDAAKTSADPPAGEPETSATSLSLDAGKRWQTDEHTRASVARLKALMKTEAPETLGSALAGEINALFAGCTMQGAAHDQLHIYLADLLGHVISLHSSETPDERSLEIDAIQAQLKRFEQYFE